MIRNEKVDVLAKQIRSFKYFIKIKTYILKNLFPHLKLKEKNISKPKRAWIYFEIFSQVITVSYIALFLNLHHLFKYHYIDLEKNQAFISCSNKNGYKYSTRELLSHKLIHTLQYQAFGLFTMYYSIPMWVRKGYPTYASKWLNKQKNFDLAIDMLKKYTIKQKLTMPEFYPLSALAVKNAIEDLHFSVKKLHKNPPSDKYILQYLQNKYLKEHK